MLRSIIGPNKGLKVLVPSYKMSSSTLEASYIIFSSLARCFIVALV
jgi:hypothetical protein